MAKEISKRPPIFIENGQDYRISSHDGHTPVEMLPQINSTFEETDVRVVLYIKNIEESMPHIKCVRVRAKDSDIFSILLYYARLFSVDIIMDTGERLISVNYDQDHVCPLSPTCIHWVRLHFSLQG